LENDSKQQVVTEYQKDVDLSERRKSTEPQESKANPEGERAYEIQEHISKLALNIKGLSCSSCISRIKSAASTIDGINEIFVDIAAKKAEIYYDNRKLENVALVADIITESGYPATVVKTYSPEEIRKERDFAAARSKYYVVSVGGWDIARSDFNTELEAAKERYARIYGDSVFSTPRGKALLDSLRAQIASRLINEGIIMQEITKAEFRVQPIVLEDEFKRLLAKTGKEKEAFKASIGDSGYSFQYFKKKFENQVVMNKYLEERVLADASVQADKSSIFRSWFNNAKLLADIVYYDKELERVVQERAAQRTCGG
jgi:copper chaperone CopZ